MTIVSKDCRNNWRAEDTYDLGNNKQLTITTNKMFDHSLCTRATVSTVEGGFVSHMMYQDFSKCIKLTKDRCTAKNVEAQHAIATGQLEYLKQAVATHYSIALV